MRLFERKLEASHHSEEVGPGLSSGFIIPFDMGLMVDALVFITQPLAILVNFELAAPSSSKVS